jgi:hypothetical protein
MDIPGSFVDFSRATHRFDAEAEKDRDPQSRVIPGRESEIPLFGKRGSGMVDRRTLPLFS